MTTSTSPLADDTLALEMATRLAAHVRRLRAARGWTQAQLAERAQLSAGYLGQIERARVNASLATISALAQTLRVDAQALLEGTTTRR